MTGTISQTFRLTPGAWTRVAFNASQAIVVGPRHIRIRGHIGQEAPPIGTTNFFPIRGLRVIRGIRPFDGLYLRADTASEIEVTVYGANDMSGVMFFGKTPFRAQGPGQSEISLPFVPQTLDGGAPDTDYTELSVIDCGSPTNPTTLRAIDGRIQGEAP